MLRIIIRETDCSGAANVGGPVHQNIKSFDVDLPEVEAYLLEYKGKGRIEYLTREVIGVEIREVEGKR